MMNFFLVITSYNEAELPNGSKHDILIGGANLRRINIPSKPILMAIMGCVSEDRLSEIIFFCF
jgi:hypothetical protein